MEIRENDTFCIFAPLSPKLDKREALRLFSRIAAQKRKTAIDLSFVTDCTIEFIEELKKTALKQEIGIFNIPSDIFVLFNIMNLDKYAKLYSCEPDFEGKTRQLINRRFSIV